MVVLRVATLYRPHLAVNHRPPMPRPTRGRSRATSMTPFDPDEPAPRAAPHGPVLERFPDDVLTPGTGQHVSPEAIKGGRRRHLTIRRDDGPAPSRAESTSAPTSAAPWPGLELAE